MKRVLIFLVIALMPCLSWAQRRNFGAGIIIGGVNGISVKYWLSPVNAIDGALSVRSGDLYLHGDYLWHDYRAFPKPEEGRLPLYYGVGANLVSDGEFGIRFPFGIEYIFEGYPFDIFLELVPVLTLSPAVDLSFTGGLGARYYFGQGSRR